MNWMSKKVGVINDDKKRTMCHTVKNNRIDKNRRKSYMSNFCNEKFTSNEISLNSLENDKKQINNQERIIVENLTHIAFNEESILKNYLKLKYLNFD